MNRHATFTLLCASALAFACGGKDAPPSNPSPSGDANETASSAPMETQAVKDVERTAAFTEDQLLTLEQNHKFYNEMPFPNFDFTDLNGEAFELGDYIGRGQGIYLAAFRPDAPRLEEALATADAIYETIQQDPAIGLHWAVVGVLYGVKDLETAKRFVQERNIRYRVAVDLDGSRASLLHLRRNGDGIGAFVIEATGLLANYSIGYLTREAMEHFPSEEIAADFYLRMMRRTMRLPDPAPAFSGLELNGTERSFKTYKDRNLLLFFFSDQHEKLEWYADAINRVYDDRALAHLEVLGVYAGPKSFKDDKAAIEKLIKDRRIEYPVIEDAGRKISESFFLTGNAPAFAFINTRGFLLGRYEAPLGGHLENPSEIYEDFVRGAVGLPKLGALQAAQEKMEAHKERFAGKSIRIQGRDILEGAPIDTNDMEGQPKILFFFNPTCPHCREALAQFLTPRYKELRARNVNVLGISLASTGQQLADEVAELSIPFPVLEDPEWDIRNAWGLTTNVPIPTTLFINAEGETVGRVNGFENDYHLPLYKLMADRLMGDDEEKEPGQYLLPGFSGVAYCGACHADQLSQHGTTSHALAYDSLLLAEKKPDATHPPAQDDECVQCHVTGFKESGGFAPGKGNFGYAERTPHLLNVGCESCHSAGGPHMGSAGPKSDAEYEKACLTCHTSDHSLNFEYKEFVRFVNHTQSGHVNPEDRKLFEGAYVGNETCATCHADQTDHWKSSPHANAWSRLSEEEQTGKCATCHTTGFGAPGGFSLDDPKAEMRNVGCESCHGPGAKHAKTKAKSDILGMGAECEFCVIERVCASCHDAVNDPLFDLLDDLEKVKHGKAEAKP